MSFKSMLCIAAKAQYPVADIRKATRKLMLRTGKEVTNPQTVLSYAVVAQYTGYRSLTTFVEAITG